MDPALALTINLFYLEGGGAGFCHDEGPGTDTNVGDKTIVVCLGGVQG